MFDDWCGVDAILMDTIKLSIGFLAICGISFAAPPDDGNHESKRIQSLPVKTDHYSSQTTIESPIEYSDPYNVPQDQIEISEKYEELPGHRSHLQDKYHEEKTTKYLDNKKVVPQPYKFGFEIKDKKEGMQFRQEQKDEHGTIKGRFGYRDAKGQFRHVEYVADDHGFRANIKTNEAGLTSDNPASVEMHVEPNTAYYPQSTDDPSKAYRPEPVAASEHPSQQTNPGNGHQRDEIQYRASVLRDYPGYEAYRQQKHDDHEVTYYRDISKPIAEKHRSHSPQSHSYFVNNRNPHTGYEHSSVEGEPEKDYRENPRPSPERYRPGKEVSPPSTYQYELEGDRYLYKYVKRPSHANREAAPQVDPDYEVQDYRAPEYEYTEEYREEGLKHHPSDVYDGHRSREIPGYERKVILPQRESHLNHREYQKIHGDKEYSGVRVVPYGYPSESGKNEEEKETIREVPVSHQYIRVINEPQQQEEYKKGRQSPYGYRQIPHEKVAQKDHQIVYVHPEPEGKHEPDTSYGDRGVVNYHPQHDIKLVSHTGYHGRSASKPSAYSNDQLKIGKSPKNAVLEINPEVYKKLIQNKSPGTRFVAVPVDGSSDSRKRAQPHGILHIPLTGDTPSSLDLKSLVLQIPQKQEEKADTRVLKYQEYLQQAKRKLETYSQETQPQAMTPIYKPIRNPNKDYSKTQWVPMNPSYNHERRKTPYEVTLPSAPDSTVKKPHGYGYQITSEDALKLLQEESSTHSVGLERSEQRHFKPN